MARVAFQTAMRAAAVQLLMDYSQDVDGRLQVYPGRPRSIHPPTAFIDRIPETIDISGHLSQRTPRVEVLVLHGLFDSKDAVNQRDEFVDGFLNWALDRYHSAGPNTLIAPIAVDDEPDFVSDWQPESEQRTYFATRITLEGYASD